MTWNGHFSRPVETDPYRACLPFPVVISGLLTSSCPQIVIAYLCQRILFQLDLLCTGWPTAPGCIELARKDNCQVGCCIFHQQTAITASKRHCNALSRSGLRGLKVGCEQAGRVSIASQPTCFATASYKPYSQQQTKKKRFGKCCYWTQEA